MIKKKNILEFLINLGIFGLIYFAIVHLVSREAFVWTEFLMHVFFQALILTIAFKFIIKRKKG